MGLISTITSDYIFGINSIVILMRTDKPDKDNAKIILYRSKEYTSPQSSCQKEFLILGKVNVTRKSFAGTK